MNILGWVAGDGRACAWAPAGMPLHAVFQPLVRAGSPSNMLYSRLRCTHWLLLPRRVKAGVLPLCSGTACRPPGICRCGRDRQQQRQQGSRQEL